MTKNNKIQIKNQESATTEYKNQFLSLRNIT